MTKHHSNASRPASAAGTGQPAGEGRAAGRAEQGSRQQAPDADGACPERVPQGASNKEAGGPAGVARGARRRKLDEHHHGVGGDRHRQPDDRSVVQPGRDPEPLGQQQQDSAARQYPLGDEVQGQERGLPQVAPPALAEEERRIDGCKQAGASSWPEQRCGKPAGASP